METITSGRSARLRQQSAFIAACILGLFCVTLVQAIAQSATPKILSSGKLKGLAHKTSGTAAVYETGADKHVLRLTKLDTTLGPETRVYLVKGDDASKDDIIKKGDIVDLGELKGNKGNQTYTIPGGTDLAQYRSVSIWCRRFSVNFAAAPLKEARPAK